MDTQFFQGSSVDSNRILYTPSSFAKNNLLYLQETGSLTAKKPHISRRENLPSYLFFIVESGHGTVNYNGEAFTLYSGDCIFIDCIKSYSHQSSPDPWTLKWVHFNGSAMDGIYKKFITRSEKPTFHTYDNVIFTKILSDLYDTAKSDSSVRDMKISEILSALLTQIMTQVYCREEQFNTQCKLNIAEVKTYIDIRFPEKITLDELSAKFYINKFYLTRIFKKEYGISIMSYVMQKRITKAKEMLRFTDKTHKEIGIEVGISEPYYFSRIFKQLEGISPSEYRKLWHG